MNTRNASQNPCLTARSPPGPEHRATSPREGCVCHAGTAHLQSSRATQEEQGGGGERSLLKSVEKLGLEVKLPDQGDVGGL